MRALDQIRGLLEVFGAATPPVVVRDQEGPQLDDRDGFEAAANFFTDDDQPRPPAGFHPAVWPR